MTSPPPRCHLCDSSAEARYQCPRCHVPYCSLTCYRGPNHVRCSEAFYEGEVRRELAGRGTGDSKTVLEVLQRSRQAEEEGEEQEAELDSDDEEGLAGRLEGIDLDRQPEEVWKRMTAEERVGFERAVATGDIRQMLPNFTPWWEQEEEDRSKISEIGISREEVSLPPSAAVPLTEDLPGLSSAFQPSPLVRYGVVNALFAYCHGVRLFNGEQSSPSSAIDFAAMILDVSAALGAPAANFDSFDAATTSAASATMVDSGRWADPAVAPGQVRQDIARVIRGPTHPAGKRDLYLLAALSDLKRCLSQAVKVARKKEKKEKAEKEEEKEKTAHPPPPWTREERLTEVRVDRAALSRAAKKADFYLNWAKDCGDSELVGTFRE